MLLIIRAGNAISAEQRFTFNLQTNHEKVSATKAKTFIASGGEAKEGVIPMVN